MKKLEELFKRFKSFNITRKVIWILAILFILAYILIVGYVFFLYVVFSAKTTVSTLLDPLGLDFKRPLQTFILWGTILLLVFVIDIARAKKTNFYLWGSIFISLALIIFGASFIGEAYGSNLPSSIPWTPHQETSSLIKENCPFSRLDCKSVRDKRNYVEGDEAYCTFSISENCSFKISNFKVDKIYLNQEGTTPINVTMGDNFATFKFSIEKSLKSIWVNPKISNGTYSEDPFYIYMEFNEVYSDEEYLSLMQSKSLVLITLISISLFSSFVAMNNLRQIIRRN